MEKNKAAAEIWFLRSKDHFNFAKGGWKEN